jgi:hypothetical protein
MLWGKIITKTVGVSRVRCLQFNYILTGSGLGSLSQKMFQSHYQKENRSPHGNGKERIHAQ